MNIDLKGRVAIVTGGARGIGRAIAIALGGCGAKVAVVDRDKANADAVAREIGDARAFLCDVTAAADVAALVEAVERELGSCDILVNNAGITRDNLLMRMKDEEWDAVVATNLLVRHSSPSGRRAAR